MGKEIGPLQQFQKEADKFKKQVDKQVKDSNKAATNSKTKNDEVKLKEFFKGCYDIKLQVDGLLSQANDLSEEKEPAKVKDFEKKKNAEIKRITTWQTSLQTAMDKLLPDEKGATYLKELKGEDEEDEEEEEGEEEEGEDEEEEGEDDEDEYEEDTTMADTEKDKTGKTEADDEEDEDEEEGEDEYETDEEEETDHKKPAVTKKEELQKEEKEEDEEEDEEEEDEEDEDEEEGEDEDEEDEDEEKEDEKEDETKDKKGKKKKKEETEDTMEVTSGALLFEALCDYNGQEQGDLSFKIGEILKVTETRDDGWWEAENDKGEMGVVPSTFLKAYSKYKDLQQDDDEEQEEEDEEEEGDEEGLKTSRSGKHWGSIKKVIHETSATDVLHAFGALPSGYRPSTLRQIFHKDSIYRMKNYLAPKLSKSNLFYRDLFYDPQKSKIIPRQCIFDRVITINACRQIPVPTQAITVKSRFVRICLFDGQNVLSNIHVIKATSADREEKTWSFSTKVSDVMEPFQHAEVFVRTNHLPEKVGILFELGFTFIRNSSQEPGEVSCGWVLLDLYEPNGALVQNKSFDLYVNGGTPYEKNVEVDPAISRRTSSNAFMSLISGNKQPRLNIKVAVPNREKKELMDHLPDVLVGNMALLHMYSFYRQILADTLLKDRVDLESTELVHSPFLASFPEAADQMDLMKIFREAWIERTKAIRGPEKNCKKILLDLDANVMERDIEYMKTEFQGVFLSSVYPLLHVTSLPKWCPGDLTAEQKRHDEVTNFQKLKTDRKGMLAMLLSSDIQYEPFDMKEVSFNVIGPYCQNDPMMVTVQS